MDLHDLKYLTPILLGCHYFYKINKEKKLNMENKNLQDDTVKTNIVSNEINGTYSIKEPNVVNSEKWYNNKTKLALSFILFPVFLYGVYQTSLLKKESKYIAYFLVFGLLFINKFNSSSDINGTYYVHTDNSSIKDLVNNSAYFKIYKKGNIFYHSDGVSGYYVTNNEGHYTFSPDNNVLSINWESGELPSVLHINNGVITIGESTYIKE